MPNLPLLADARFAVLGFGSQGHAHALNLRDAGVRVDVGLEPSRRTYAEAVRQGFAPRSVAEVADADVLVFAVPDVAAGQIYREFIQPVIRPGQLFIFLHGFALHYGLVETPEWVDVGLVAPLGPGAKLREAFVAGSGLFAMLGVHRDGTGIAKERTRAYAELVGCTRVGTMETTVREETETDLFGEQAVLCGGFPALLRAGYETLVEAGYAPEAAYFECVHQIKVIADLLVERGIAGMYDGISGTAAFGGLRAADRVIGDAAKQAMREVLAEVRSGAFAREWIAEAERGAPELADRRATAHAAEIERVGQEIRQRLAP